MAEKLVRDNVLEELIKDGGVVTVRGARDDEEFRELLSAKLQETVNGFMNEPDIEKLADILEVTHALGILMSGNLLDQVRKEKALVKGHFAKRMVLTIPE